MFPLIPIGRVAMSRHTAAAQGASTNPQQHRVRADFGLNARLAKSAYTVSNPVRIEHARALAAGGEPTG